MECPQFNTYEIERLETPTGWEVVTRLDSAVNPSALQSSGTTSNALRCSRGYELLPAPTCIM
ncbi:hypothetical protein FACS1894184_01470 [Clostridia bacterium]|nr:hypothetical protein FACS1894184_01470 [Clostridia bacterium]